ncbi:LOW QUALITY PROTEIN: disintegrin and metalloproteinase domain-containing protein 15-like [Poeciliopsis prolifica]|uniref:LOW QUALITY PROTEIN: disintegrin and metalloproteinase domain-containing protein 15-like n=1 Tax=Poeciliopsis prolifica TaxID=188132 RepID=UPI0024142437|nr:LOW QUALITY PROTEIN: disintegrin and metalloproteinase domain-containing protein 15-like [Poeciliopsis prolifica]
MSGAAGPPLPLLLLLLAGRRAAFMGCRSLNAPQDGAVLSAEIQMDAALTGVDRQRRPFLEKTRPFVLVDGQRRSLAELCRLVLDGHPDRLLCELEVGGQRLLLDLEKNHNLLPRPPNIFFYLPNGTGVSLPAEPVTHCYYHGNIRGFPRSRAALSTCSGLRGVIVLNSSVTLELQPEVRERLEEQGGGAEEEDVHLLFSAGPLEGATANCAVPHTPSSPSSTRSVGRRTKRDILSETKHVELVLVADHQEFLNYQRNNQTIVYRLLDVANQVDWFYRPLKVRVALTGLEVWSDRDKIRVQRSPTDTLNNFLEWRSRELLPRLRHDNAQLIMGESFDGTTVGMASQSSMCSRDRSGGVNVDHLVSVLGVASTVAHELGHNLGMRHDTAERRCSCDNEPRLGGCIMEPSTGFMPGQQFSSCSAADLSVSLLHGGGMCLFNVPQPDRLLGGPRCGNLYVEKGEECDCGLLEECDDPCCNASTCQLVPGAQCSSDGICCEDCKMRAAGSMCREPLGECDLPEYCTGSSPHCPPNVFLQNGEACRNGASYCYGGVCADMDSQCQMLWGNNASSAPAVCFSSVNKQGNKYGNCGQLANGSYIACSNPDVLCGRIQCQGGTERPLLGSIAQILTVRFNHSDLVCRGTFFHLDDDVSDPATVAQGTACGPGKVRGRLNQKCEDASVFGVEECRRKCSGHGVCNSNRKCHCDAGWAPPDCRFSGRGGSVDSGPAAAAAESDPVQVALLLIFFFILPVVLLFLALRFPRFRRTLCCLGPNSPFHKARQHNRATERVDGRHGEQVRPLRYHLNPRSDGPAPPRQQVHDRPPPTKPLPPDPALTPPQQLVEARPAAPTKPLPPDPVAPGNQPPASRPAPPNKPLPPDPPAQVSVPLKPIAPKKPRPLAPPTQPFHPSESGYASSTKAEGQGAVAPAAGPHRRPPSRPAVPPKFESSPPL